ncbi:MAG: hypothetical protein H7A00_08980 [Hahellaceae bacterium]|nr:hypothetical protein [Hahellaceae bacterium]
MALSNPLKQSSIPTTQPNASKTGPSATSLEAGKSSTSDPKKILSDEYVTLSNQSPEEGSQRPPRINSLIEGIGKDTLFMRETLRNKIAEMRMNPATRLEVKRDAFGRLQAVGNAPAQTLEKISKDLNNSQSFREAFSRTQQHKPTADYINNASKLQQAYGVSNQVCSSVISHKGDNSLDEITFRYQKLKEIVTHSNDKSPQSNPEAYTIKSQDFSLVLNA